jgi:phosphoribosylformylglycinamidine synthase
MDNFCWPSIQSSVQNPDAAYKAAQLVRACWGLKDACLGLGIPLLSGKDSMYVDGSLQGPHGLVMRVSAPPTMMFTASAPVHDLEAVQTLEPKVAGDLVYVIGAAHDHLGGGGLYKMLNYIGRNVPQTDFERSRQACLFIAQALRRGLLASTCVPSRGGLALALARMVLAADVGLEVELKSLPAAILNPLQKLFSESTGRFVITVNPRHAPELESALPGMDYACIGKVTKNPTLTIKNQGKKIVALSRNRLERAFSRRFGDLL